MGTAKENILGFVRTIESRPRRKKQTPQPKPKAADLFIPLERMSELMTLREAHAKGLLRGNIASLNRKASAGDLKAVKIPGVREWFVLPEWIEEFHNQFIRQHHAKTRV